MLRFRMGSALARSDEPTLAACRVAVSDACSRLPCGAAPLGIRAIDGLTMQPPPSWPRPPARDPFGRPPPEPSDEP